MRLFLTLFSELFGYSLSSNLWSYVKTFDLVTTMICFIVFFSYGHVLGHLLKLFKIFNNENESNLKSLKDQIYKYIISVISISFIVSAMIEMFSSEYILNYIYNIVYLIEILSILVKIGFSTFVTIKFAINKL